MTYIYREKKLSGELSLGKLVLHPIGAMRAESKKDAHSVEDATVRAKVKSAPAPGISRIYWLVSVAPVLLIHLSYVQCGAFSPPQG